MNEFTEYIQFIGKLLICQFSDRQRVVLRGFFRVMGEMAYGMDVGVLSRLVIHFFR